MKCVEQIQGFASRWFNGPGRLASQRAAAAERFGRSNLPSWATVWGGEGGGRGGLWRRTGQGMGRVWEQRGSSASGPFPVPWSRVSGKREPSVGRPSVRPAQARPSPLGHRRACGCWAGQKSQSEGTSRWSGYFPVWLILQRNRHNPSNERKSSRCFAAKKAMGDHGSP